VSPRVLKQLGLDPKLRAVFAMICRLAEQKGLICSSPIGIFSCWKMPARDPGSGERRYEDALRALAAARRTDQSQHAPRRTDEPSDRGRR